MQSRFNFAVLAVAFLGMSPAFAAPEENPSSVAEVESDASWAPSWLYADFFSNYHGSNLNHPVSSRSMTPKGEVGGKGTTNFDSEFGAGYRLSEKLHLGLVVPFLVFPGPVDHFTLGDAGVKLSHHNTLNWRGIKASTNLILQAPTSNYSRDRNMKLAAKTTPSLKFEIPDSDFSLGAWNEAKAYFGATQGPTFKLWTLPYLSYRLNRKLSAQLGYELDLRHFAKAKNYFSNYQHDWQLSLAWKAAQSLTVSPYLQFFELGNPRADNIGVGATVSAQLL